MGSKIVISHPTGNENTRHAVHALLAQGMLAKFITCVACFPGNVFDRLSRLPGLSELGKRTFEPCLKRYTKTYPFMELARHLKRKLRFLPTVTVDDVYHHIDNKVAAYIGEHHVDAVYAYDDGAYNTFTYAKANGVKCLFDLPIIHWRTYQRLLKDEKLKNPEWADILGVYGDPEEKLKRKDRELMMADAVFVASSFTKRSIIEDFPYKLNVPVYVVPYGFPPVNNSRVFVPIHNRKVRLLYVGRLSQAKGMSYLFDAVNGLEDKIELTVVGGGDIDRCRALRNALERVNYLPSQPHDKVLRLMAEHDVLVFPSLFDGFGMVITEAMSQGTPVVATDRTCGVDFIEHGKNGWLVKAGDGEGLRKMILEIIENKAYIEQIGRNAMKTAAMRPWNKYEDELAEKVKEFLDNNGCWDCSRSVTTTLDNVVGCDGKLS